MSLRDDILAYYNATVSRPGRSIRLAGLRVAVPADRAEMDRVLLEMNDERVIQLEPDPDRRGLTDADREAAIVLGGAAGKATHLMRVVLDD